MYVVIFRNNKTLKDGSILGLIRDKEESTLEDLKKYVLKKFNCSVGEFSCQYCGLAANTSEEDVLLCVRPVNTLSL